MMRFLLAIAVALGAFGAAQAEVASSMRQAFVENLDGGPAVVFLTEEFRAAPTNDLLVVTYTRPTPSWHFNSPRDTVDRVLAQLSEKSSFNASHLVAIFSEKPVIRIFIEPVRDLDLAEFSLPHMTIAKAAPSEIAALKSIGGADFARYLAEGVVERGRLIKQLFGDRAPGNPRVELTAVIAASDAGAAEDLRRLFRKTSPVPGFEASFTTEDAVLTATTALPFEKARVLQFFTSLCDTVRVHRASCIDWRLKTETQAVQISPQG